MIMIKDSLKVSFATGISSAILEIRFGKCVSSPELAVVIFAVVV